MAAAAAVTGSLLLTVGCSSSNSSSGSASGTNGSGTSPDGSSQDELNAVSQLKGQDRAPDV
jgi:hypothetical protein